MRSGMSKLVHVASRGRATESWNRSVRKPVPQRQSLRNTRTKQNNTSDGNIRLLLQIFSGTVLGPAFFEFIQRKGDDGFGEGNPLRIDRAGSGTSRRAAG